MEDNYKRAVLHETVTVKLLWSCMLVLCKSKPLVHDAKLEEPYLPEKQV